MAKITLSGGFKNLDEGHYTFRIKSYEYKEDFGKLHFVLETKSGKTTINRYDFGANGDKAGAINSFSFFAKAVLNNPYADEVDPEELVGKYVEGDVIHRTGNTLDNNGDPKVFVNYANWKSAKGFDGEETAPSDSMNLDDILDI